MKRSLIFGILFLELTSVSLAFANADLMQTKNCNFCHQIDSESLGPSFKSVAERYYGKKGIQEPLIKKVLTGGSGEWGAMAMPPNVNVSNNEAKELVYWILSLKKAQNSK